MTALAKNKINRLARVLKSESSVEFKHNGFCYEVFKSADSGFIVNLYSSNEKDEEGAYQEVYLVDGGVCDSENHKDVIEFML